MTTIEDVLAHGARWCVVHGESPAALEAIPKGAVHALVTDPPSGIAFMGKKWDHSRGGRAAWTAWLADILGAARARVRDGGRALVWSLPRTSHWTGCAVEDADWIIETTVSHLFGTGWPKAKSQLKPAHETWWLARTGRSLPLNLDECRVGEGRGRYPPNLALTHAPGCTCDGVRRVPPRSGVGARNNTSQGYGGTVNGFVSHGHAEADGLETIPAWTCVEGCPVLELDRQTGGLSGESTASRLFPQFQPDDPDDPWNAPLFQYIAKPSQAERNTGCDGLATTTEKPYNGGAGMPGRTVMDGQWVNTIAERRERANDHPTVKPVEFMRWLIRLVSHPGDIILDTCGGSGTTGVAALLEARRVILIEGGSEESAGFVEIARARCAAAEREALAPTRRNARG